MTEDKTIKSDALRDKEENIFTTLKNKANQKAFETIGLLLIFSALALLACLVTYSEADVINYLLDKKKFFNIGGRAGFLLTDKTLNYLGLACYLIPLSLLSWGFLMFYSITTIKFRIKVISLISSIISLSFLLGIFKKVENYLDFPLGGYLGEILLSASYKAHFVVPSYILAFMIFIVSTYSALEISSLRIPYRIYLIYNKIKHTFSSSQGHETHYRNLDSEERVSKPTTQGSLPSSTMEALEDVVQAPPQSRPQRRTGAVFNNDPRINYNNFLPISLLSAAPKQNTEYLDRNHQTAQETESILLETLKSFGIVADIMGFKIGPVITMFEIEPSPGIRASRIIGLSDDIARSLKVQTARISIIPGKSSLAIEIPNSYREIIYLRQMFHADEFNDHNHKIPICLGKNIIGTPIIADLTTMPHLLVAGTTGSGKSVGINSIIISILYKLSPEKCKFVMIDPKMLELSVYNGIPHLLWPVVTSPEKAVVTLQWVVKEMERRYKLMSNVGVRGIFSYNEYVEGKKVEASFAKNAQEPFELEEMPYIIVVIDEMADLMITAGKIIESCVQRLSQMARAAGIHVIMATQRPSVDVITGIIKANFPVRISYQVTSKIDSRTILNFSGAEQLLGKGDMIYMPSGSKTYRIHAPFVSDKDVANVTNFLSKNYPASTGSSFFDGNNPQVANDIYEVNNDNPDQPLSLGGREQFMSLPDSNMRTVDSINTFLSGNTETLSDDEILYEKAVSIVKKDNRPSISYIQRKLKIGYNKAATIMEKMEDRGIVSAADTNGKRMLLTPKETST